MTDIIERVEGGKFKKGGRSPNPKGRPKKSTILKEDFKSVLAAMDTPDEKIEYLVDYLITNAKDEETMFKYVKEFLPYVKPKLSNIKNEVKEDKTITITWLQPEQIAQNEIKVIDAAPTE